MIDKTYILHFSESSIIFLVLTETARPSSSNRQRKFVDLARLPGVTPLNIYKEPRGSHITVQTEHRQHNGSYNDTYNSS